MCNECKFCNQSNHILKIKMKNNTDISIEQTSSGKKVRFIPQNNGDYYITFHYCAVCGKIQGT